MTTNRQTEKGWYYHNLTKHSYWSVRTTPHFLDWGNRPEPFKIYPNLDPQPLPREMIQTGVPALEAIEAAGQESPSIAEPTSDQLASILFYSAGVTKKKAFPGGEIYFRAAACAGALYPVETYVVCGDIEGLAAGVYHFGPGDFALRPLRRGDHRNVIVRASASEEAIESAPVILVFTAITWRSSWKYRDRSYRYHFWDNGMIATNAMAMSRTHRLPARVVMGFVDEEINNLIGIDGRRELALSLFPIGKTDRRQNESAMELSPLDLETLPLSTSQTDYSSIQEMHRASSLESSDEVKTWREGAFEKKEPQAVGQIVPLSIPDRLPPDSIEEVIVRRASTRHFAPKPLPFDHLSIMLDRAAQRAPFDCLDSAVHTSDIYLIVNAVEELPSGAYFYRKEDRALELLKEGEFRKKASYLTLEQDLGGDASATIFFMAEVNRALDQRGNRGYRLAQMEAGMAGGRAYLASYSLGRGATGLTFYDDDVTEFFSPHAKEKSCMLVVSLGIPGKRPFF